jgi:hypothetical protein
VDKEVSVLVHNYVRCGTQFFKACKEVAVGSPICNNLADIFLKTWENIYVRHDLEDKTIMFYSRYADNIFIVYDSKYIRGKTIEQVLPVLCY